MVLTPVCPASKDRQLQNHVVDLHWEVALQKLRPSQPAGSLQDQHGSTEIKQLFV